MSPFVTAIAATSVGKGGGHNLGTGGPVLPLQPHFYFFTITLFNHAIMSLA